MSVFVTTFICFKQTERTHRLPEPNNNTINAKTIYCKTLIFGGHFYLALLNRKNMRL